MMLTVVYLRDGARAPLIRGFNHDFRSSTFTFQPS